MRDNSEGEDGGLKKYMACKMRGLTLYIRGFLFFPRYKIEPVSNMIPFAPGQAMGEYR